MQVAYFVGCAANYFYPDIGRATVEVLRHNGIRILVPEQKCCGLPHFGCGDLERAKRLARANVASLLRARCDIVTACTSCALALREIYPRLVASEEAKAIAPLIFDVSEYLARLERQGKLRTDFLPVDFSGLYHAPCHLKTLGQDLIRDRLHLLRQVPGIRVEQIDRGCCGMAGSFGLKRKNYPTSMKIGESLFSALREKAPPSILTDCPGCTLQISQATGLPVRHPVQLLRRAYGL